jgi:hypothetical protein
MEPVRYDAQHGAESPKHCAKPTQYDAQQPADDGVLLGAHYVDTTIHRVKPAIDRIKPAIHDAKAPLDPLLTRSASYVRFAPTLRRGFPCRQDTGRRRSAQAYLASGLPPLPRL